MMKAGTYYVGDLCYVMHEAWKEFCDLTIDDDGVKEGQFRLKDGREFAFMGTAYGDGTYSDQEGRQYGVDAGLIGCIRLEDIYQEEAENWLDGGHVITFDEDFEVSYHDGVISFGHVEIDTDPSYGEEYDDYYDDDEDE